jgi:hypothetical protein
MKQYRIAIKHMPRGIDDKYPWSWMVLDEQANTPFGNLQIVASDRERRYAKAKRNAEKIALKLSKASDEASKYEDETYLYPRPTLTTLGPN